MSSGTRFLGRAGRNAQAVKGRRLVALGAVQIVSVRLRLRALMGKPATGATATVSEKWWLAVVVDTAWRVATASFPRIGWSNILAPATPRAPLQPPLATIRVKSAPQHWVEPTGPCMLVFRRDIQRLRRLSGRRAPFRVSVPCGSRRAPAPADFIGQTAVW